MGDYRGNKKLSEELQLLNDVFDLEELLEIDDQITPSVRSFLARESSLRLQAPYFLSISDSNSVYFAQTNGVKFIVKATTFFTMHSLEISGYETVKETICKKYLPRFLSAYSDFQQGVHMILMDYAGESIVDNKYRKEVLEMLEDLKSCDLVHEDLHQGNILVKDGKVFLIDFESVKKKRNSKMNMKKHLGDLISSEDTQNFE